jgi:hypothetical protein
MSLFSWRPALLPAAVLGSFTHLVLDGVTYGGVPLWWPFAYGRVSFPLFHWLVAWLLPVSALPLLAHAAGRLSRRRVIQAGALAVAALVVLAGVRLSTRPWGEPEGARVYSTDSETAWVVATPLPNGSWEVTLVKGDARTGPLWFRDEVPSGAAQAVERARDTDAYRGFRLGSFGPVVTAATPMPGDGWNVTFTDVAQRYEALVLEPGWTPADPREGWGYVSLAVTADGSTRALHRGW